MKKIVFIKTMEPATDILKIIQDFLGKDYLVIMVDSNKTLEVFEV